MCAVLAIPQLPYGPFTRKVKAATERTTGKVETTDPSASIPYIESLEDLGNGSFRWKLDMSYELNRSDNSVNSTVSQNGYLTADVEGDYLIELWGGKGGDGGNNTTYGFTGGAGGDAGYVNGVIHLEVGQTIFYEIGGNGDSVLSNNADAANGGSGHSGLDGFIPSIRVGGGGGYSAIYLFEPGEFDSYVDENGQMKTDTISESDRLTKYVMIAGGGGGGGGANYRTKPVGTADGGNAGSISGTGISVTGLGTYYAGEQGRSSGTSFKYIGKGGTDKGGAGGEFEVWGYDVSPNGSTWAKGGAGATGVYRGGGGGAGYAGGGGGTMESATSATSIGGGGGGSSFIGKNFTTVGTLPDGVTLQGEDGNTSTNGGAVHLVNLSAKDSSNSNYDYLRNIALTWAFSPYFDTSVTVTNSQSDVAANNVTATGTNVALLDNNGDENNVSVEIIFTPKSSFAGGNDVPLFVGDVAYSTDGHGANVFKTKDYLTRYVNVPVDMTITGNSCSYDSNVGPVPATDLYTLDPNYANVKANAGTEAYPFIESVSDVMIDGSAPAAEYTPAQSTVYQVSYDIALKSGSVGATVGRRNKDSIHVSATANIVTVLGHDAVLNGNQIQYQKSLSYDGSLYHYLIKMNSTVTGPSSEGYVYDSTATPVPITSTFEAPEDGYYLIQAWGGNGGDGAPGKTTDYGDARGGNGADGGYYYTVVKMNAQDKLTAVIGSHGADGTTDDKKDGTLIIDPIYAGGGGKGGTETGVALNSVPVLVAAGGSGGGGGSCGSIVKDSGGDADSVTNENNIVSNLTLGSRNGNPGNDGGKSYPSGGNAGTAKKNAKSVDQSGELTNASTQFLKNVTSVHNPSTTGGYAQVTLLEKAVESIEVKPYDSLEMTLSPYFVRSGDVVVTGGTVGSVTGDTSIQLTNVAPNETGVYDSADPIGTSIIIDIPLKPIDGFLGGNDVPVLAEGSFVTVSQTDTNSSATDDSIQLVEQDDVDYANVAIPEDILNGALVTQDATYVLGGTAVAESSVMTYTQPSPASDPCDDFVTFTTADTIVRDKAFNGTPSEDFTITYTVSAEPTVETPTKAVVIPQAYGVSVSKDATILVKTSVGFAYTNVTSADYTDNSTVVELEFGNEYSTTVVPNEGYEFTEDDYIKVMAGGKDVSSSCVIDTYTGKVTIPEGVLLTSNVVIEATASVKLTKYEVKYLYQTSLTDATGTTFTDPVKYQAEELIHDYTTGEGSLTPTTVPEGYTFVWQGFPEDGKMPTNDLSIVGYFEPNPYTVTVHYTGLPEGKKIDDVVQMVYFGDSYTINTPIVEGYDAEISSVTGTVDADFLSQRSTTSGSYQPEGTTETITTGGGREYTVEYTPTSGKVIVNYLYEDGSEAKTKKEITIDTENPEYSFTIDTITGYTAYLDDATTAAPASVSETATAEQITNGVSYTVTYKANVYKVTFDTQGGAPAADPVYVKYGNTLGYTAAGETGTYSYNAFPVVAKEGSTFNGWKLNGSIVEEDMIVDFTQDVTLVADWTVEHYNLIVLYEYADGTTAVSSKTYTGILGEKVTVDIPEIYGYTASPATLEHTMVASEQYEKVTYTPNKHNLSILYMKQTDEGFEEIESFRVEKELEYGKNYSYTSPSLTQIGTDYCSCSAPVVSGTMQDKDTVVQVYYYQYETVYNATVEWGSLVYNYSFDDYNPLTHSYEGSVITPEEEGVSDKVTVTNVTITDLPGDKRQMPINVDIKYTAASSKYSEIIASFDKSSYEDVAVGSSVTSHLTIRGTIAGATKGNTYTTGKVTVTLSGGKEKAGEE